MSPWTNAAYDHDHRPPDHDHRSNHHHRSNHDDYDHDGAALEYLDDGADNHYHDHYDDYYDYHYDDYPGDDDHNGPDTGYAAKP